MDIVNNNELRNRHSSIGEYTNYYSIYEDDKIIGFSAVNKDSNNMIYVYVEPHYRGNGFGTRIFNEMVEMFKNDIILTVETSNVIINRIISHYDPIINFKNTDICIYQIKRD